MRKRFDPVPILVVLAILIALPVLRSVTSSLFSDGGPRPQRSPGAPRFTTASDPKAQTPPGSDVGLIDPLTNGLDSDRLEQASALGSWLRDWEDLSFRSADSDELRDLAAAYRRTGYGSKSVRALLRDAARMIDEGETAAEKRQYESARARYGRAAIALRDIPPLLRRDSANAEKSSGARIAPRAGERLGYEHLFPVETEDSEVTVTRWIDGDTVETSAGRVRLIGIDTPEMTAGCSEAAAAKQYAESAAPAGSTLVLRNPASVVDNDRYDRLLRYVDVPVAGDPENRVMDVGYSLFTNSLAAARYDSLDGYQWHPREQAYRRTSAGAARSERCDRSELAIVPAATTLANSDDSPEYWRKQTLGKNLLKPYLSATKYFPKAVAEAREQRKEEDRLKRQRERERRESSENDTSSDSGGRDGSGGGYPGYTGPRCYAPGGKTWKPC